MKVRIFVILGPSLANKNTLHALLSNNINVVGAIIEKQEVKGINLKFLKIAIKKQGVFKVILQIFERILYKILHSKKDAQIHRNIFNEHRISQSIERWGGDILYTDNCNSSDSIQWIKDKKPDYIIIHTKYWVGKKIRNIVNGKVIGGHPGITQFYRGVHSPFWAIYHKDFDNVGYTVFWVGSGLDAGDIIAQGKVPIEKGDSYITLSWKGMTLIAQDICRAIKTIEAGGEIQSYSNDNLVPETIYYHPTIFNYLKYKLLQKHVR